MIIVKSTLKEMDYLLADLARVRPEPSHHLGAITQLTGHLNSADHQDPAEAREFLIIPLPRMPHKNTWDNAIIKQTTRKI